MKKNLFKVSIVALAIFATSCKSEKKNETTAEEAQEVAVANETAMKYVVADSSMIEWKGEKPTGTHHGIVMVESGEIMVEAGTPQSGDFVIDMTSITVQDLEAGDGKEDLEAHLKGTVEGKEGDFFNVTEYPDATFEMTGITEENGKTMMQGNLTIKGKTNNISFPVTVSEEGDMISIDSEPFTIDRTKWDVNYGSKSVFDNLGDKFIYDDMELTVHVKAEKASA
ncbi:YceI family protein [Robertkochia aurantiaca]|uniref:YceI family protein n=1 Tax=Robertkochia aurantiaca TaxID=2873700 RepID=UPI001CCAD6DA|nr:YceI family protein [Robertkochia sp. 3YJGBD-33]